MAGAGTPNAGGLAVALDAALKTRGGLWFGWSGETAQEIEANTLKIHEFGPVSYAVADLSQRDLDEYYLGFSNRALWPVCHYRLDLAGMNRKDTAGYFRVNESFARRLAPLLRPDDVIWVHDYHFIPLAMFLRQMGFTNRIGFFLHIPWAPPDLATVLPAYETLIRGFAAYDLVGFQTPLDAENFGSALTRGGYGKALGQGWFDAYGRKLRVQAFPIGIDTAAFKTLAEEADRNAVVGRTRASLEDKQLIIGVDRLDYSKGIPERIDAFSCFIEANPAWRNRVTFLQITPKSRSEVPEYARMQQEVAEQIGSTNGQIRRCRLDADPLHQQADRARGLSRALPARAGRAGDAAARRHEPRRQGICGGAVERESRSPGAVAFRGRGGRARQRAPGQPV
jgi:trehalose 6-phosphate synthase